jgi:hypothetical protein
MNLISIAKNLLLGFTLAVIVCFSRGSLWAQQSYCPQSISVKQTPANIPEGWTASQDNMPNVWEGVTFYSGPPEDNASLVYHRWAKRNGVESGIWHFAPKSSPPIWLSCRYSFTSVTLSRQLSADTTECTVTYKARTSPAESLQIQKIACR